MYVVLSSSSIHNRSSVARTQRYPRSCFTPSAKFYLWIACFKVYKFVFAFNAHKFQFERRSQFRRQNIVNVATSDLVTLSTSEIRRKGTTALLYVCMAVPAALATQTAIFHVLMWYGACGARVVRGSIARLSCELLRERTFSCSFLDILVTTLFVSV